MVQQAMLSVVRIRKNEEEYDLEVAKFEQNMFINNPELYKKYMEKKEQDAISGNTDIQWLAPESVEEAAELVNLFSDIDKQLKEMEDNPDSPSASFLDLFGGINVDEIGGDE
jgi:hypothetical protein